MQFIYKIRQAIFTETVTVSLFVFLSEYPKYHSWGISDLVLGTIVSVLMAMGSLWSSE